MKKLKIGLIGYGRSGRDIHTAAVKNLPELYEIVAVTDFSGDSRERAARELGCRTYDDYRKMASAEQLDLVVNASYSHMHVPVSVDLLDKGFNVLSDKPLARNVAEVDKAADAAARSGKLFAVFHQSRFAPYFRKVKEIADSGIIGRIVQVSINFNGFGRRWDWQTLQEFNGGNLLNTGPHPVDQAVQFFGTDVKPEVFAVMDRANTFGDAEDYVHFMLRAPGKPVIDVEISSCCAYPCPTYNIQGTRGGISATMTQVKWKYFKPEEAPVQHLQRESLHHADGTPSYCEEELIWHEDSWDLPAEERNFFGGMAEKYYRMLYESLVNGAPLAIKLEEVRRVIEIMEICHLQNPLSRLQKEESAL